MRDYGKIAAYLAAQPEACVTLTFAEVGSLLGEPLPLAARVLYGWWVGGSRSQRDHAMIWQSVGWRTTAVDLYAETFSFVGVSAADS